MSRSLRISVDCHGVWNDFLQCHNSGYTCTFSLLWRCCNKGETFLLVLTQIKFVIESRNHTQSEEWPRALCQGWVHPVAGCLLALHSKECSEEFSQSQTTTAHSFTPATNQWERNKTPFTFRAQQVSLFPFGVVFTCSNTSQAICAKAFTSEHFTVSKGNFFSSWSSQKATSVVEGMVVFVMKSSSEIARFWMAGIAFSSLLDF